MTAPVWQVGSFGEPVDVLELVDAEPKHPGAGEVRVDVRANGLNFLDASMCRGSHPMAPQAPFVLGAELVGVVTELGSGVDGVAVGARVVAMSPTAYGCFRTDVVVPDYALHPVPEDVPDADAASLHVTYQAAHVALVRRARVAAGEWVLVNAAAGALGSALLQIAVAGGARVIATAGSAEKRERTLAAGAEVALDSHDAGFVEAVRELTGGKGVDVVCDTVGGALFDASLEAAAFEARVLPLGYASGTMPGGDPIRFVSRNLTLVGVSWGAGYPRLAPDVVRETHAEILRLYRNGRIRPWIDAVVPSRHLPAALQRIADGRTAGKTVVTWGD